MRREGVLLLQLTLFCVAFDSAQAQVMSFNQTTYSVSENSGNITVSVFLIGGVVSGDEIVTVSTEAGGTATAGGDYTPVTTELTFNSTNVDVPQTVTIFILDDLLLEGSEFFNVTLTSANSSAILTDSITVIIEDEDRITIGFYCPGRYSVTEDAGSVSVTVETLRGTPARDVIVTLQTIDSSARAGVEYKAISTNLIFNVSMPIHVVSIPIFDDLVVDNSKSFSVALTTNDSAVTLRLQTASVRIYDNDRVTIGFNSTTYFVSEGAGRATLTVNILNGTLARGASVYASVRTLLTGGTATVTLDYTLSTSGIRFDAATSTQTVTVPILEDDIVENCEIVNVTLSGSSRTVVRTPRASICIVDNDEATFGFNPTYSVSEDVGNITVAVSLLSGILARDLIVSLLTLNGTAVAGMDFQDTSTDLTFNRSSPTQTAIVSILNDPVPEHMFEYFSLILASTDRAAILDPTTANVTIVDDLDMVTIGFNPVTYSVFEEAGSVNVTVSILNGTLARNIVVALSTTPGGTATAYTDVTLTFGATISTQMAAVDIFDDSVVEETEFINLTLSSRDSAAILSPATAIVSVEDGDTVQVGFEYPSYLVAEDSENVTVCATATGQLAREVTVTLSTSDETAMAPDDYTFLMQDLTFNATVARMCVNMIIASDSVNEVAAETFTVFLNSTDSAAVLGQSTTVTIVDCPIITIDPSSQRNVFPGTSIMFTIEAIGSDLTYQWQWNKDNLTDGTSYNGTTTASLTVMNITEGDEGNFTCVVTNAVGSVISNAAQLILLDRPKITQQPDNQLNLDPGSTAMFTVTATTAVGTLTYQWQIDGIDLLSKPGVTGTNTHTLTLANVQMSNEANYSCVVTNARGSVMSHPAQLTILNPPTIVTDPHDVFNVIPGHNVTFTVVAAGLRLAYTWQLGDGSALPNDSRFITNDEMLTIRDVMLSDPNSYLCVVTNAVGNATSNSANFTLIDPPTITVPPQSTAADIGSNTEFMCTARGEGTLTFTWITTAPVDVSSSVQTQFNLQDGSETNTLSLTNVGSIHSGTYACSVSNERGSTGPYQATLTIIEISDIPDRTVTLGRNTTFTCSATGPGDIFYRWNRTVFDRNGVLLEIGFYNESHVTGEDISTLTVVDVGVMDEGRYTCFVSINGTNAGGKTAILSTRGPVIFEQPLSINLLLLSNLTLKCSAQNNADAPNELEFYWYRNGHSIIPNSRVMIDSTGENATRVASSELAVMQVTDSDSGEYQCTVTNRDVVDGVNATADVTVIFTPVLWFLSGMIRRDATTSLLLECTVEAVPPVAFIEIRRRSQEGDVRVLSMAPGSSQRLTLQHTLQNLMVNDSAVYVCVANNSVGLKKQNFTLVVQAPPDEMNHTTVTRELLTLQSVRLTWVQPEDNNAHINSYNVTYCASVNYSCVQLTQTQIVLSTHIILQLIPVMTYQVYIRADNDVGQGPEPKEPYFLKSATQVDAQPVGLNVAFVTATSVVLVWQLPTVAESAGINSFILSYNIQGEDSEGNTTHTRQPSGEPITRTVPYQQGRTPGAAVSGLESDALYEFRVSVNYSNPVLLSAAASVTVRTSLLDSTNGTTDVQQNFIIVSWPPAGGAEFVMNYILVYNSVSRVDQQTTSGNITISSNQTDYNFTSPFLQPHSNYSFLVFANFGNGRVTQIGAPFTTVSQEAEVQGCVLQWREEMVGVTQRLREVEENMRERLGMVEENMKQWRKEFNSVVDLSGVVHAPERSWLQRLWREIQHWQEVLNEQLNQFSGDVLLSRQEDLKSITSLVENWTEVCTQIFSRHEERGSAHKQEESPTHKQDDHAHSQEKSPTHKQEEGPAHSQEQEMMVTLNGSIRTCLSDYAARLSGENGVATSLIHLITPLETWDSKFRLLLNSTDGKLPDLDWIKFKALLGEWEKQVHNIWSFIGHTPTTSDESLSLEQLQVDVEKWQSVLSHAVNCQDTRAEKQILELHSALVKWMVGLLLALTETQPQHEEGEEEGKGEGEGRGERERYRHTHTTANLKTDLTTLLESLTNFTTALTRSCMNIVRELVDERRREGYPDAEEEQEELRRLGEEAGEWSRLAGLLLQELTKGEGGEEGEEVKRESPERKESQEHSTASGGEAEEGLPDKMSVIGEDDNIHSKSLQQAISETTVSPMASPSQLGLATEEVMPEGRGTLQKDAEALVIALDQTKQKLKEQEEMTKQTEENLGKTKRELEESRERETQLESELQQLRASVEQTNKEGPSGRTSRASSKGGKKAVRPTPPRSGSRKRQ